MFNLQKLTQLEIYPASVCETNGVNYFLGRHKGEKFVGSVGEGGLVGQVVANVKDRPIIVGPTSDINAEVLCSVLPWTAPQCLGLATSVGLGDRLGLATPGHIRAIAGSGLEPILAQQSIREMTRTQRTPRAGHGLRHLGRAPGGLRATASAPTPTTSRSSRTSTLTAAAGFTHVHHRPRRARRQ